MRHDNRTPPALAWTMGALLAMGISSAGAATPPPASGADPAATLAEIERAFGVQLDASAAATAKQQQLFAFLNGFPASAQQSIVQLAMGLAKDPRLDPTRLVKLYQERGAEAAFQAFPKDVRDAITQLGKKLEADPRFNNPQSIQAMLRAMMLLRPTHLGSNPAVPGVPQFPTEP